VDKGGKTTIGIVFLEGAAGALEMCPPRDQMNDWRSVLENVIGKHSVYYIMMSLTPNSKRRISYERSRIRSPS